jgi:hypothetical protein
MVRAKTCIGGSNPLSASESASPPLPVIVVAPYQLDLAGMIGIVHSDAMHQV